MGTQEDKSGMIRLIATVLLSTLFLVGWQYFYDGPKREKQKEQETLLQREKEITADVALTETKKPAEPVQLLQRSEAIAKQDKILKFNNGSISGSINLRGAMLDNLSLIDYKKEITTEEKVDLFSPIDTDSPYVFSIGWIAKSGADQEDMPTPDTLWQCDKESIANGDVANLSYTNKNGQTFHVKLSLDDKYMFTVEQTITNNSPQEVQAVPYVRIRKKNTTASSESYQGPIGLLSGAVEEVSVKNVMNGAIKYANQTSYWAGFSDKYWLSALIYTNKQPHDVIFDKVIKNNNDILRLSVLSPQNIVQKKQSYTTKNLLFVGAKDLDTLDYYAKKYDVKLFDRAIDFGMFHFLARPVLLFLKWIFNFVHNYGFAIIIMTIAIRIAMLPLAAKSFKSMAKIRQLAPMIAQVKENYKDDKQAMNKAIMELYVREKINPVAGILPLLLQIPIFFALYKVLYVSIEMRHSPFLWWITDLSAPDSTSLFNLFGLLPYAVPQFLNIGVLPILMGLSMWLQQKLGTQVTDPTQAQIMKYLPWIFTFLFASFPSGLVIYWIVSNLFSIAQQYVANKKASS
jgi:YidC/Oxa1 family membrane protein insertase